MRSLCLQTPQTMIAIFAITKPPPDANSQPVFLVRRHTTMNADAAEWEFCGRREWLDAAANGTDWFDVDPCVSCPSPPLPGPLTRPHLSLPCARRAISGLGGWHGRAGRDDRRVLGGVGALAHCDPLPEGVCTSPVGKDRVASRCILRRPRGHKSHFTKYGCVIMTLHELPT